MPDDSSETRWLLLAYKVANEPSKLRVGLWRRLRGMGAVYIQGGVCVLRNTSEYQRQLRALQGEVLRAGGEAVLFEVLPLDPKQQALVVDRFKRDRDDDYEEFLDKCSDFKREVQKEVKASHYSFAELQENEEDLKKLRNWLAKIEALDHFGASARALAERELSACEQVLDAYANTVFDREHGIREATAGAERQRVAGRPVKRAEKGRRRPRKR
ncbi:MAG TPA: Chromate resistance protein ChrB [Burkholderiaceae bacterium]|nr:Chromate resistance protein ChrB [Burkholderiaceae bacterium]